MKKGLAAVWVIIITVLIMAGLGAGGWYYMDGKQKAQKKDWDKQVTDLQKEVKDLKDAAAAKEAASASSSSSSSTSSSSTSTPATNPWLYTNSTYGFTLTFNSLWQGYTMKEATNTGSTKTYYVCVPTTDSDWAAASSTSNAGTVSIFALSIYTQAQWTAATSEEGPTPSLVGQSGSWYVGYSPAQAYPADKATLATDVHNVIATFAAI